MKFKLQLVLIVLMSLNSFAITLENCHQADERLLKRASEESYVTIDEIVEHIDLNIEFNNGIDEDMIEDLMDAKETILCAREKINDFNFKCYEKDESGKNRAMVTLPFIGKDVDVYAEQMNDVARTLTFQGVVGIVIHEATHKCGTTDSHYFIKDGFSPYSSFFNNWSNIADTFSWWALKGFCIPHENGKFSHVDSACVDGL